MQAGVLYSKHSGVGRKGKKKDKMTLIIRSKNNVNFSNTGISSELKAWVIIKR